MYTKWPAFPNICGLQALLAFILDCQNSMVTVSGGGKSLRREPVFDSKTDTPKDMVGVPVLKLLRQ